MSEDGAMPTSGLEIFYSIQCYLYNIVSGCKSCQDLYIARSRRPLHNRDISQPFPLEQTLGDSRGKKKITFKKHLTKPERLEERKDEQKNTRSTGTYTSEGF